MGLYEEKKQSEKWVGLFKRVKETVKKVLTFTPEVEEEILFEKFKKLKGKRG